MTNQNDSFSNNSLDNKDPTYMTLHCYYKKIIINKLLSISIF